MTITANIVQNHKNAAAAGTVLGTQALAAPATWTRLTSLDNTIPTSGAVLKISSSASAFRVSVQHPESAQNTSQGARELRDNGILIPYFGTGSGLSIDIEFGAQVWVKQP